MQRLHIAITDAPERIARIRWPKRRKEIGPFAQAPLSKRNAAILVITRNADLRSHIDRAADTDGGIHDEAAEGRGCTLWRALKDFVSEHDRQVDVDKHIVDAVPRRFGNHRDIAFGGWLQDVFVYFLAGVEHGPVGGLEGVVLSERIRTIGGAGAGGKRKQHQPSYGECPVHALVPTARNCRNPVEKATR